MIKKQRLLSALRSRWKDLARIETLTSEPGFIGAIPYLLLLRWIILVGIVFRFILHRSDYTSIQWSLIMLLSALMAVIALGATFVTTRPDLRRSKRIQGPFVASDVLLISLFYWLSKNTQSDFFLFYYLPIFAATEYLGGRAMLVVSLVITLAFASVIVLLLPTDPDPTLTSLGLLLRVFVPREIFFVSVVMTSSFLLRLERVQRERASRRETEMQTLLDFKASIDQLLDQDQLLELTLRKAISIVEADGGYISLLNSEAGQLELKSCAPLGFTREEPLSAYDDCVALQVVRQRRPKQVQHAQSDANLRRILSERIHTLLYVPIIAHNTVLGVLALGTAKRQSFSVDTERFLEALVGQVANAIERAGLLTALYEIGGAAASTLELDHELDFLLEQLTERLGFEFASISLVDDYRRTIEMIRGRNIPPGWIARSKYRLDQRDILTDIVNTGRTEVIQGWDDRFNLDIYERYGHDRFARVFVPLIADNEIVGVIEAGCQCEWRMALLTPENIREVERLGQEKGGAVARTRPHILLELIANRAIKIIGADSASIHVYQFDQVLLEAGAGKATKDFLHRFPPREPGMGRKAMRAGTYVVLDRSQELAETHPTLYKEGVRAIAAFPLSVGVGVKGVLYIHFWQEHRFSEAELELEQVFARQMVIVIQNTLLLKSISEAAERAWMLSGLQNLIQSLASSFNLTQVLKEVVRNVLYMLDADNVTLYQYFQSEKRFEFPPVMEGSFRDRGAMQTPIYPHAVVWRIVQDGEPRFMPNVLNDPVISGVRKRDTSELGFIEREGIISSAALVLKAGYMDEIVGLMFVNHRIPQDFPTEARKIMSSLASSAAIAIKTARLYDRVSQELSRRNKELEALRAVDQAIVAGAEVPELQQSLEFILERGLEIIGAPVGNIMWFNRWNQVLELRAQRGFPEDRQILRQNLGEGIVGLAARTRETILVPNVKAEEWAEVYVEAIPETRSELAVPLADEDGLLGVLNVEHPEVGAFDENDKLLMETLAIQAIIAIHTVDLYQKLESQIRSLHSLAIIASRIQDARYEIDSILRLILTGVTAGEGLGFSRAVLFLTSGDGNNLQGKMAIGAQMRQEAEAIWKRLDGETVDLRANDQDVLTSVLNQAEEFSVAVRQRRARDCPLSLAVQEISLPIERNAGSLSQCMLERRPIIVKDGQPDPFRKVIERVSQPGDMGHAFACVPLVGKGKAIGALMVDNRFLISEKQIDKGALSCLETFAGVAAMSVENARLRSHLAEEQRLATWKEFTAQIAHIIGTRIAVIEGSVTKLRSSLPEEIESEQWAGVRTYLKELTDGIFKANRILADFRAFVTPLELRFDRLDLAQVIKGVIREIQHSLDFPIELILAGEPTIILGDPVRLSDAFIELIRNAQEAMQQDAGRVPQLTITTRLEMLPTAPGATVCIEFADSGPGIPDMHKQRLFEPFFSTKHAKGSGLGLTIIKSIIEQHNGTIEEVGTFGMGAKFIIRLPAIQ